MLDDGTRARSTWLDLDSWYYFDDAGIALTGIRSIDGVDYAFDDDCRMAVGWVLGDDGSWYYANPSGDLASGWKSIGGSWYWLDPQTHKMAVGLTQVQGAPYYFTGSGAMATGWVLDDGAWYYADASGAFASGWRHVGGSWYWLDPQTHKMATGWTQDGGAWYYLWGSGAMAAGGWIKDADGWHWLNASGDAASGWAATSSGTFYFEPAAADGHCRALLGEVEVQGKDYYIDEGRGLATSAWVGLSDGRRVWADTTGELGIKISGGLLRTSDGQPVNGWVRSGTSWFYANAGVPASGWLQLDGWYYLDPSTYAMHTGWLKLDGTWYWLDDSGRMATGWRQIDGAWYNFSASGAMSTTYYHNIQWAGQPNNFFCGPTSGFMILRNLGAWSSASGAALNIENVATYMQTRAYGYTSFQHRMFERGMNGWLGDSVYTSVHTPSYETARTAILNSYQNGHAPAVDAMERRGGPHYNGHNNGTFAHIMVVDGYDESTDAVQLVDPGAGVLWPAASQHFWYPSLREFVSTYLDREAYGDGLQHIGIYFAVK